MSFLEEALAAELKHNGIGGWEREHRFAPPRRFRFDFAWPAEMLAAEIQGGSWTGGRHVRGKGFQADCEKLNLAVIGGWRVLKFTGDDVRSGEALRTIRAALRPR